MKHRKITSATIATALLLPLAAWGGQSGTTASSQGQTADERDQQSQSGQYGTQEGSRSRTQGTSRTSGQYSTQQDRDQRRDLKGSGQSGTRSTWESRQSGQAGQAGQSGQYGTGQSARTLGTASAQLSAQVQRVEQAELETRVTAKDLIGKQVKDRNGEAVGKVKDIGLDFAFSGSGAARSYQSSTASPGGAQGTVGISGSAGSARIGAETPIGGSTGAASADVASSGTATAGSSLMQGDVSVFIEVEGEDAMVSVPASELSFDHTQDELTLQRSSGEIMRIARGESEAFDASGPAE